MADSKKQHFSKSPILKMFLWKFHKLVLGLVELIDAKGIYLAVRMSDIVSKSDSIQLEPVLSDLIQIINLGSNKGNLLALLTFRIVSWIV